MSVALRSPKRWTVEDDLRFEETAVESLDLVIPVSQLYRRINFS